MGYGHKYADVIAKAEHYKALGQTTIYLDGDSADLPWDAVDSVEECSLHRLNGPAACYMQVHQDGLVLRWSVEFEGRDANGRGISLFDRERLRTVATALSARARTAFAYFLADKVLPGLEKSTAEIRDALGKQIDSEDCVRGLIAFAKASA